MGCRRSRVPIHHAHRGVDRHLRVAAALRAVRCRPRYWMATRRLQSPARDQHVDGAGGRSVCGSRGGAADARGDSVRCGELRPIGTCTSAVRSAPPHASHPRISHHTQHAHARTHTHIFSYSLSLSLTLSHRHCSPSASAFSSSPSSASWAQSGSRAACFGSTPGEPTPPSLRFHSPSVLSWPSSHSLPFFALLTALPSPLIST